MTRSTPGGFDHPPRRAETVLLVVQTLFYSLATVALLALAGLFYGYLVDQKRYHDRQDEYLKESLKESRIILKDHEIQREAHQAMLRQLRPGTPN